MKTVVFVSYFLQHISTDDQCLSYFILTLKLSNYSGSLLLYPRCPALLSG